MLKQIEITFEGKDGPTLRTDMPDVEAAAERLKDAFYAEEEIEIHGVPCRVTSLEIPWDSRPLSCTVLQVGPGTPDEKVFSAI